MLCYMDKTFCPFWEECNKGSDCRRALNVEVVDMANYSGLGICQFTNHPDCFEEKEDG